MSDKIDPYSESISDIVSDEEFQKRWAYCRPRLQALLIKGQLVYAKQNEDATDIGRFSKFTLRILDLFDQIEAASIAASLQSAPKRPKLHQQP